MNKTLYVLWAMVATLFNNHVETQPAKPLTFRRGDDDLKVAICDYEKPGWVAFTTPQGETRRELLADSDIGQLIVAYGRATGVRIELPLLGYGDEQAHAASASGAYGDVSQQ